MPKAPKKGSNGLRAVGITCGIGSMLIGARQAGFRIVGNVEWRKYYYSGTFEYNFPGAFMVKSLLESPVDLSRIDLVMGHTECGSYSNLKTTSKAGFDDPGDIPEWIEMVKEIHPRYFVMDNLPKSFIAVPMEKWASAFPGYDLFPEWVSNYHYGNVQINRRRMFMIAALRSEGFTFVPGEFRHEMTLREVIADLPDWDDQAMNHLHAPDDRIIPCGWAAHQFGISRPGNKITLGELKDYIRDYPVGKNFLYLNKKGELHLRPGYCKIRLDHPAPVMTGGGSALDNHYREDNLNPLTIRERARIQGCPDDFVFLPLDYLEARNAYMLVYKQTGKFMPVQFCRYISEAIASHVLGRPMPQSTGARITGRNPYVDEAKEWYCKNVGYSRQELACSRCWIECNKRRGGNMVKQSSIGVKTKRKDLILRTESAAGKIPSVSRTAKPPRRVNRRVGESPALPAEKDGKNIINKIRILRFGGRSSSGRAPDVEEVRIARKKIPDDYHCRCRFCRRSIGELIRKDGSYYSRLERRKYYSEVEQGDGGHIAKTPLHIARWAVQAYTEVGDWVLDPTAGAGTTIVESLVQGRNAAGVEIQYEDVISVNSSMHSVGGVRSIIGIGDARSICSFLKAIDREFSLVVNNPPYFGDQSFPGPAKEGYGPKYRSLERTFLYDRSLPNLAFLKEGPEYWDAMSLIYSGCAERLTAGGRFVIGVKDQMRSRQPDMLHEKFAELLSSIGLRHEGTAFLRHYPPTLHLNTYEKRFGARPPMYQTILVFRKG